VQNEFEKLYHEVETKHFWFRSRRNYIISLLKHENKDLSVLDIGCSSGILLNELHAIGFKKNNLFGVDISEKAIENCKANGIENAYVMDGAKIELNRYFDIVIASDCLEHIEDDQKALSNWHSLLNENGKLYVFVPAFMTLWSQHDVVNMHFRRYTKSELVTKLNNKGFQIVKSSYWNCLLFLPLIIVRPLSRLLKKNNGSESGNLDKPGAFNGVLYQLINFENKLLKSINFPFGVSTFCIAKK
jgi:2-polyprenyl-3-methyl-5-hydroxy-6-metoxy-1,4-benzoquinol methylase